MHQARKIRMIPLVYDDLEVFLVQYGLFTVTAWIISNTDSPTPRYLSAKDRMLGSFIREVSGLRIDWY